jgi:arabinose-5-phosphate isomerase
MVIVKKAHDICRKQVFFCNTTDSLAKVAYKMHNNNIGSILVRKDNEIRGIITVNDMMRTMSKHKSAKETLAKDIMSSPVISTSKDMEIDDLVEKFNQSKVSRMVLLDKNKKIAGVVRDIAVYKCMTFHKYNKEAKQRFQQNYMRPLY